MSTEIDFKFVFLCYGPLLQMENDFFFLYMRGFVDCYTSWMVKGKGRLLELQCLFHTDLLEPRG